MADGPVYGTGLPESATQSRLPVPLRERHMLQATHHRGLETPPTLEVRDARSTEWRCRSRCSRRRAIVATREVSASKRLRTPATYVACALNACGCHRRSDIRDGCGAVCAFGVSAFGRLYVYYSARHRSDGHARGSRLFSSVHRSYQCTVEVNVTDSIAAALVRQWRSLLTEWRLRSG